MLFNRKTSVSPQAVIQYRKSKQHHKVEIKKLKRQIKKHKMLKKQARLAFKIAKQ